MFLAIQKMSFTVVIPIGNGQDGSRFNWLLIIVPIKTIVNVSFVSALDVMVVRLTAYVR